MKEYKNYKQKRKFYDSGEWKQLREKIKKRDNYECQECKRHGRVSIDTNEFSESAKRKKIQLVVHHINWMKITLRLFVLIAITKNTAGTFVVKKLNGMMRGGNEMLKTKEEIQNAAKEKVKQLLEEYDVGYIDYNVSDDEYTIRIEKTIKVDG